MADNTPADAKGVETYPTIPELGSMGDVPLEIEIVLDKRVMRLGDVVSWQPGTVLALNKAAGEPLDILVSGTFLGHGEIEVSHDNVGLRITSLAAKEG